MSIQDENAHKALSNFYHLAETNNQQLTFLYLDM